MSNLRAPLQRVSMARRYVTSLGIAVVACLAASQTTATAQTTDESSSKALLSSTDPSVSVEDRDSSTFDLASMTDDQAEQRLDEFSKMLNSEHLRELIAKLPPERAAQASRIVEQTTSSQGRAKLVAEMRAVESDSVLEKAIDEERQRDLSQLASTETVGGTEQTPAATTPAPPSVSSNATRTDTSPATTKATAQLRLPPSSCPLATGALPAPPQTAGGTFLTPHTNSWLSSPVNPTQVQGDGNDLNGLIDAQIVGNRLLVRVHLQSPKPYSVAAYDVVLRGRKLGDTQPERVLYPMMPGSTTVTQVSRLCYQGDTDFTRGYWQGLVTLDPSWTEPGFQLTSEIVEYEPFFECGPFFSAVYPGGICEPSLTSSGAQYFGGGNRITLMVGGNPTARSAAIPNAVGAFVTNTPGNLPSGSMSDHSVLADTNADPNDDAERVLNNFVSQAIEYGAEGFHQSLVYEPLLNALTTNQYDWTVEQGGGVSVATQPGTTTLWTDLAAALGVGVATLTSLFVELRIDQISVTTPQVNLATVQTPMVSNPLLGTSTAPYSGYQAGYDHQLAVEAHIPSGIIRGGMHFFTLFECTASLNASASGSMSAGLLSNGTELSTRFGGSMHVDLSGLDMDWYDWMRPGCIIGWLLAEAIGELVAGGTILGAVFGVLHKTLDPVSLSGLNGALPEVNLLGTAIKPELSAIHATCPQSVCPTARSLITPRGIEALSDVNIQVNGASPSAGQFPFYPSPSTSTSPVDLITSHADAATHPADIGAIVSFGALNLLLRDLTQGSSSSAANGLLNQNVEVPIGSPRWYLATKPTVAPFITNAPGPNGAIRVILADLELALDVDQAPGPVPVDGPMRFKANLIIDASLSLNAATGQLVPNLSINVDLAAINCLVDYNNAYAWTYPACGDGGTFNIPNDIANVINFIANNIGAPLIRNSLGAVQLPLINELVPSGAVQLGNKTYNLLPLGLNLVAPRIQNRGGYLGVYADLAPAPRIDVTAQTWATDFRFHATPYNFPGSGSYNYSWRVTDENGPFVNIQANATPQKNVALSNFGFRWVDVHERWKEAIGEATVSRGGTSLTSDAYAWAVSYDGPGGQCSPC